MGNLSELLPSKDQLKVPHIILVCTQHGKPPKSTMPLFNWLGGQVESKSRCLDGVPYAVYGLGMSLGALLSCDCLLLTSGQETPNTQEPSTRQQLVISMLASTLSEVSLSLREAREIRPRSTLFFSASTCSGRCQYSPCQPGGRLRAVELEAPGKARSLSAIAADSFVNTQRI